MAASGWRRPRRGPGRPDVSSHNGAGFRIDATADKRAEGVKRLRCLFKGDRTYDHIQAMTPDGE